MEVTRGLSLRQPWASAICAGLKRVENRPWANAYRGPIAVHASATKQELNRVLKSAPSSVTADWFPTGAIVGVAEMVDIVPLNIEMETDLCASGPFCWLLKEPRFLSQPIPFKGRLQLFHLTAEVTQEIAERLRAPQTLQRPAVKFLDSLFEPTEERRFEADTWRMLSYFDLKLFQDARRCADRLIALRPEVSDGWRSRAYLQRMLGDFSASMEDYAKALAVDPGDAAAYWYRAELKAALGDKSGAAADHQKALDLDPDIEELLREGEPKEEANT